VPLVFLPSSSAVVRRDGSWDFVGPHDVEGALP
jgi:hypothetical protein